MPKQGVGGKIAFRAPLPSEHVKPIGVCQTFFVEHQDEDDTHEGITFGTPEALA